MNSGSTCGCLAPSAVLKDLVNVFPCPQPFPTTVSDDSNSISDRYCL